MGMGGGGVNILKIFHSILGLGVAQICLIIEPTKISWNWTLSVN